MWAYESNIWIKIVFENEEFVWINTQNIAWFNTKHLATNDGKVFDINPYIFDDIYKKLFKS